MIAKNQPDDNQEEPKKKRVGAPKKTIYVKRLEKRMKDMEAMLLSIQQSINHTEPPQASELEAEVKESKQDDKKNFPVPEDYRQAVNNILNEDFGVLVEPQSDSPEFNLIIVVPNKYSSMSLEEHKMHKADLRSKNISYAEKTNGVRAWAEKVYESFNPETRAQIVKDRRRK